MKRGWNIAGFAACLLASASCVLGASLPGLSVPAPEAVLPKSPFENSSMRTSATPAPTSIRPGGPSAIATPRSEASAVVVKPAAAATVPSKTLSPANPASLEPVAASPAAQPEPAQPQELEPTAGPSPAEEGVELADVSAAERETDAQPDDAFGIDLAETDEADSDELDNGGNTPPGRKADHTIPGEYIVVLKQNARAEEVSRAHGLNPKHQFSHALNGFAGHIPEGRLQALLHDPRVVLVEPDVEVFAFAQTIPTGIKRIGATQCPVAKIDGIDERVNVDVAILDTGIDLTHPDLNVFQSVSFTADSTTGNDGHGHGTHVAGIVGALDNNIGVVGVAPGARLWAVKVLDNTGSGSLSGIISGVDYVTQHASQIEVANMSLGGRGTTDSLRMAIQNSVAKGVIYVVAAGNANFEIYGSDRVIGTWDDFFPACYPEVMTISAMADTDGQSGGVGAATSYGADDTMAAFSNYSLAVVASNPVTSPGLAIDVAAPGVNVYSTYKGASYATMSGTSMAAPHVAGLAALHVVQYGRAYNSSGVYAIRQSIINGAEPQSAWGINPTNPNPYFDFYPEALAKAGIVGDLQPNPNTAPHLTISSPANGSSAQSNSTVQFCGSASDSQDGDLSKSIVWTSNINGSLGTGAIVSSTLSVGSHIITATVTDSAKASASASVTITVSAPNTPPTVSISSPVSGATVLPGSPVQFSGSATDVQDGNLSSAIVWKSSIDGALGIGASVSRNLTTGSHTITATATDQAGLSSSASVLVTVLASPNTPPTIAIISPANSSTFVSGNPVQIRGTATDTEDGTLSTSIQWTSSINGALGAGDTISPTLKVGTHTITAQVTDRGGLSATASISITIVAPNNPPTVSITSPAGGSTVLSGSLIQFSGSASDSEDGNLSGSIVWTSSIDGTLGTGASISKTLNAGTHTIRARVTDSANASVTASITITVTAPPPPPNTPPNVSILAPANGAMMAQTVGVNLNGQAYDNEDGDLSHKLVWTSNLDGALGTGASLNATLSPGNHTITASATDSGGATSSSSIAVSVPKPLLNVSVATDRATYVNKNTVNVTVSVTSQSIPVANASITLTVVTAGGRTTTSKEMADSQGKALLQHQVNSKRDGVGVYSFSVTAAATGYEPGSGSTTCTITK